MPIVGPESFGQPGSGGSLGFSAPASVVGFGYETKLWLCNIRRNAGVQSGLRGQRLSDKGTQTTANMLFTVRGHRHRITWPERVDLSRNLRLRQCGGPDYPSQAPKSLMAFVRTTIWIA
jgi:hypothetical protein